jgi:hypothetical protein
VSSGEQQVGREQHGGQSCEGIGVGVPQRALLHEAVSPEELIQ